MKSEVEINTASELRSGHRVLSEINELSKMVATETPSSDCSWKAAANFWNPGPSGLKEAAKLRLLHAVAVGSGCLKPVMRRPDTTTFSILTYHRITDQKSDSRDRRVTAPSINVSPKQFRNQLSGLQKRGFQFCSLNDVLRTDQTETTDDGEGSEVSNRQVVVTFDDIYDNVFQNAWPILQDLGIPATLFISTAFIDDVEPFPFDHWARQFHGDVPQTDWRPIQNGHLEQMLNSPLITVGAHTHTHQDFRNRPDDFAADLNHGIRQLETRYGLSHLPFAFPYGVPRLGFANDRLMQHVIDADLTCGLTTGSHTNGLATSPHGWGRFHVFDHDSAASLASKLDGCYQWLPAFKNRITQLLRHSSHS